MVSPTNGLVLFCPFNENTGEKAHDYSGQANDGTFYGANDGTNNGATTNQTGMFGKCYSFDGTDDYIYGANSQSLNFDRTDPFTFSTWIYINSASTALIYTRADANYRGVGFLILPYGQIYFRIISVNVTNQIIVQGSVHMDTSQWYHVVVTYDGSSKASGMNIYINGVRDTNITVIADSLSATTQSTCGFNIAREITSSYFFNGLIDEFRVFNRVLTQTEITALYNTNIQPEDGTCVLELHLDETSGTTAYDSSMWCNGKYGDALSFDGVNDYIEISHNDDFDFTTTLTITGWIKKTVGVSSYHIVSREYASSVVPYDFYVSYAGILYFRFYDGSNWNSINSTLTITSDVWYFIAVTFSKPNIHFYVNGVDDGVQTFNYTLSSSTAVLRIGACDDENFKGLIDEVRIYNRAINQDEITAIYNDTTVYPIVAYITDALLKKLGIPKTDSIDVLLKKLGITKLDSIDTLFKLSNIPIIDSIDVLFVERLLNQYDIDMLLNWQFELPYSIDIMFKLEKITTTNLIDTIFTLRQSTTDLIDAMLKKTLAQDKLIDVLFKRKNLITPINIDTILLSFVPPPNTQPTMLMANPNGQLWCYPLSWKETQNCAPAIRPIPLALSEYLDSDTYVLEPRTIEAQFRLSDSEKDVFESMYNYASTSGSNYFTDIYLLYNHMDTNHPHQPSVPIYTWHYVAWFSDKDYTFEYAYQDGRYVRWWTLSLTINVESFNGSSAFETTHGTDFTMAVTLDNHRLEQILGFELSGKHPPMIPKWVNQPAEVDSYLWNECVLNLSYTDRMTNDEKYLMDLTLQNHQKVNLADYVYNIIGNVWVSSFEAIFDPSNWAKPWKTTIAIEANNSEITFDSEATATIGSRAYPAAWNGYYDGEGVMYLDEIQTAIINNGDSSGSDVSQTVKLGVHTFYFFLPSNALGFYDWVVTGDVLIIQVEGSTDVHTFDRESKAVILIYGDCTVLARYMVPISEYYTTFDSYQYETPCVHSIGTIDVIIDPCVGWQSYDLPYVFDTDEGSFELNTWYEMKWTPPLCTSWNFHHWECGNNITIQNDVHTNINYFKITSDGTGYLTAIFVEDFDVLLDSNIDNPCQTPIIHINGTDYGIFPALLPQHLIRFADSYVGTTTSQSMDNTHVFDHWVTTGDVSVSDIYANPTTVTITGNGTLTAVYGLISLTFDSHHKTDVSDLHKGEIQHQWYPPPPPYDPFPEYPLPTTWDSDVIDDFFYINWNPLSSGKTFDHWEVTGGYTVDDPNSQATILYGDSKSGTITAVYTG